MIRKLLLFLITFILLSFFTIYTGNDFLILFESNAPSTSTGTIADGNLINGKRIPNGGDNFVTYSRLGSFIGRNGVHNKIREIILDSYKRLYADHPQYRFVVGETSWLSGGSMSPHRTHQNGLSVDFMVPVRDSDNKIVNLPTHVFNRFGYNIDFDSTGVYENLTIDFEAMAIHLHYLHHSCLKHDVKIDLVIFDPHLQTFLAKTEYGADVKQNLRFTTTPVWVRHDDHYHVNFRI